MTTDIDAYISTGQSIKDAINRVSDKIPEFAEWMNSDFKVTDSFTHGLTLKSKHYKSFNQILNVRTIEGKTLIAMKLKSFRKYKHDQSDIIGIYEEEKQKGNNWTYKDIKSEYNELYGELDKKADEFLNKLIDGDLNYIQTATEEAINGEYIINLEKQNPNIFKENNIDEILQQIENAVSSQSDNEIMNMIIDNSELDAAATAIISEEKEINEAKTSIMEAQKEELSSQEVEQEMQEEVEELSKK